MSLRWIARAYRFASLAGIGYASRVTSKRNTLLASAIVVFTGVLWGLYWLPVRSLAEMGLDGAWGTVAITGAAAIVLAPPAIARRRQLARSDRVALASIALGGAAFALYSIGFVYGRVAIVILLFFLTPVWSTLIGRYVMGWPTPRLRIWAILLGLAGLFIMLSADREFPVPNGAGAWMALIAGVLWSVATTGINAKPALEPVAGAFVFAIGATLTALILAPLLEPWPERSEGFARMLGLALATGAIWWGVSVASLMWATVRLEPARVGILLMTEVVVGAGSAAVLVGERLDSLEVLGGILVLCAGILEVWPASRTGPGQPR